MNLLGIQNEIKITKSVVKYVFFLCMKLGLSKILLFYYFRPIHC